MNLYIWLRVDPVQVEQYHTEGGLAVFADSVPEAVQLIDTKLRAEIVALDYEWRSDEDAQKVDEATWRTDAPDVTLYVSAGDASKVDVGEIPRVLVFPDAGCC